jgi:RimJ/RimL family protein N-acetyltransferase
VADKLAYEEYPISAAGPLFEGQAVSVGWPEDKEFDLITELRNSPLVRMQFLDNRPLDAVQNREWLSKGMQRPRESILSIRLKQEGAFLGTIGWSDWNLLTATAWFGRLAVDRQRVRENRGLLPDNYCGVGMDAAHAITHFAFERMGLEKMSTYYLAGNMLSARVQLSLGFSPRKRVAKKRPDGIIVDATEMEIDKLSWGFLHRECGQQIYRPSFSL